MLQAIEVSLFRACNRRCKSQGRAWGRSLSRSTGFQGNRQRWTGRNNVDRRPRRTREPGHRLFHSCQCSLHLLGRLEVSNSMNISVRMNWSPTISRCKSRPRCTLFVPRDRRSRRWIHPGCRSRFRLGYTLRRVRQIRSGTRNHIQWGHKSRRHFRVVLGMSDILRRMLQSNPLRHRRPPARWVWGRSFELHCIRRLRRRRSHQGRSRYR